MSFVGIKLSSLTNAMNSVGLFEGCKSLERVIFPCKAPSDFPEDALKDINGKNITLVLPSEQCLKSYPTYEVDGILYCYGAILYPTSPRKPPNDNTIVYLSFL